MLADAWNLIKEWFNIIVRFFLYGETGLEKDSFYVVMFIIIAVLFILSLSSKKGKGRPINSPFLFVVAIILAVFTVSM